MPSIFSLRGLLIGGFGLGIHVQILGLDLDIVVQLFECRPVFSLFAFVFIFVGVLFRVRVVVLVLVDFLTTAQVAGTWFARVFIVIKDFSMFFLVSCEVVIIRARLIIEVVLTLVVVAIHEHSLLLGSSHRGGIHHLLLHIRWHLLEVQSIVHVLQHGSAHCH